MQCPDCGLLNPPSTIRCDCGHVFPQDPGNDAPTDPSSRLSDLESRLVQQEREFQRLGEQLREMRREVLLLKTGRAGAPASNEIPSPNQAEQQRSTVPSDPDPRSPEFRTLSERPNRFHFGERPPSWMATREWEAMIGGSWLAKIGIFALVLGVLYFLKYAFDNEWIGNAGRVLIGAVSGVALLYGGERFEGRGYRLYGQTLAGGGIAILYLSTYAAFHFYSLIGQVPAILLMALVTAVCCALSYRYDSPTLATLGLAGGLLTPYWMRTGTSNQVGLLSYLLILDVGGAWLARTKGWSYLNVITFVGTVLLFAGWAGRFYRPENLWTTEVFLVLFAGLYLGLVFGWDARRPRTAGSDTRFAWFFGTVVVVLFFLSNVVLHFDAPRRFWIFILLFSVLALAAGSRARSSLPALGAFLLCLVGMLPWLVFTYREVHRPLTASALTVFWVLFLVADLLRARLADYRPNWSSLPLAVLNGLTFFALTYALLENDYDDWMGLLAIGVAASHLSVAWLFLQSAPAARSLFMVHVGVALTLATLAIPIQLEQDWITIGWGVEAAVLAWVGFRINSQRMRQAGLIVLVVCLVRLFAWTAFRTVPDYTLILNRRFLAFIAIVLVLGVMAFLYRQRGVAALELHLFTALVLAACTVFLIGASQEAWSYYDHRKEALYLAVDREEIRLADFNPLYTSLKNSSQLILSLLWGICSILAVIAGIVWRFRPIRLFGIGVFAVAIGKVFLLDIWSLQQIYRIISTIALGSLLLVVAFLYQRRAKLRPSA